MTHTVRLPKGWAETTLGEIAHNIRPRSKPQEHPELQFIGMDNVEAHTMRLLGTVPASDMKSSATHFRSRDVLYGRLRPYLNKVIMVNFEGLASAEFIPLTSPEGVLPELLKYRLNSAAFVAFTSKLDTGDRPRVDYGQISAFELRLPPTNEQHRIVEVIESYLTRLDDAVVSLEHVQRNLECYRASVLKAAVEGRLVPTEAELARQENRPYEPASVLLGRILAERKARWIEDATEKARSKAEAKALKAGKPWTPEDDAKALVKAWKTVEAKYKEPTAPDTTDLPELPEGWCYLSVDQFNSGEPNAVRRGPFGSTLRKEFFVPSGIKVYEQQHAINRDFTLGRYYVTQEKFESLRSFETKPGDIIMSCSGTIGRTAIVPESAEPGIINQALLKLSLDQRIILNRFFEIVFAALLLKAVAEEARGTGMQNLAGIKELRKLAFPVPPVTEQERILLEFERLESATHSWVDTTEKAIKKCQRLRQSILKWAFEGKLVEQDPNDEPASALLERIKTERSGVCR